MFAKTKVQVARVLLSSLITANTEKCVKYAQGLAPTVVSISVFDSNNEFTKSYNQFRDVWCVLQIICRPPSFSSNPEVQKHFCSFLLKLLFIKKKNKRALPTRCQ